VKNKIRISSGFLYLLMLIGVVINAYFNDLPLMFPVVCGWLGSVLLLPFMGITARKQIFALYAISFILIVFVLIQGETLDISKMFSANITMAAMFAASSFLSLATRHLHGTELLKGGKGVLSTLLGANILGAVISLAVIYVIGDRLEKNHRLSVSQVMVISRGFCAASYWSPFFVGCAVALLYSPGMKLLITIPIGIFLVLVTILLTFIDIKQQKTDFEGFPVSFSSLKLPLILVLSVMIYHYLDSTRSVIIIIAIVTPIISILLMNKHHFKKDISNQILEYFPNMGGQIALYLAAGIMSGAISGIVKIYPPNFIYSITNSFGPNEAIFSLILIIIISYMGLHPIITLSTIIPVINHFNPDPTLVGLLMLIGWGLGITVSPLSATNLSIIGRYNASSKDILKMNKYFTIEMLAICYAIFWIYSEVN
jgi:hypothetical protein